MLVSELDLLNIEANIPKSDKIYSVMEYTPGHEVNHQLWFVQSNIIRGKGGELHARKIDKQ